KLSDMTLRKKKNAEVQAAFRKKRANYIATLEEAGKFYAFLRNVVSQLQESRSEALSEVHEMWQQNANLRHEFHERENFWKAFWQSR
ncbi:hypothetical protein B0H11DRAFT_1646411, partial [Mycena galericulata]